MMLGENVWNKAEHPSKKKQIWGNTIILTTLVISFCETTERYPTLLKEIDFGDDTWLNKSENWIKK